MSFHPNDVARRSRFVTIALFGVFVVLLSAFFRTQILQNYKYSLQSEENRLREVPLPAPRGIILDRNKQIIAENVPGYSVSILSPSADSLRASLGRLGKLITLTPEQIEASVRRYKRAPARPTVVLADATFDVVSVLEERRVEYPGLIIQSAPKRYYPDSSTVASFVGYVGEVTESELTQASFQGYKVGQQVGKAGLEKQYEKQLRGREGARYVEVDARGRVVRDVGARAELTPAAAAPLYTNIDIDLQRYMTTIFGDSLQGGAIAIEPKTGAVIALYSAPSYNPNRFIGGIPADYWRALNDDPRRPLYNKVIQGQYPPGSTFKLATAAIALQDGVVGLDEHMRDACTGGYTYGTRYFRCHKKEGHGSLSLVGAIEQSCDVYFYQLGLRMGISRLIAGGVSMNFDKRSGIDLPSESRTIFPYSVDYYNQRFGKGKWTQAVILNLAIGQGENAQTVVNMARFYTALANGGEASTPEIATGAPKRTKTFALTAEQMTGLNAALMGVVSMGTARSAAISGVVLAGKTGTAQNSTDELHHHAWFTGFAPAKDPKIVIAVMLEFGGHGDRAARIASKIVEHYLKVVPTQLISTEGD